MPKGALSDTFSICRLALSRMTNNLFQSLYYLTEETLKNKISGYQQAQSPIRGKNNQKMLLSRRKMATEKWDTSRWLTNIVWINVQLASFCSTWILLKDNNNKLILWYHLKLWRVFDFEKCDDENAPIKRYASCHWRRHKQTSSALVSVPFAADLNLYAIAWFLFVRTK